MTRRRQDEFKLCCAISDYLRIVLPDDAVYTHIPNGENRSVATGARLKRMGVRPGMPDYVICHGGRALWIEVKAGKGQLSASQKLTLPALHKAGQQTAVCSSIDEVEEALTRWGVPLKAQTYNVAAAASLFGK